MGVAEMRQQNEKRGTLLQELRDIQKARQAKSVGMAAVAIPLEHIYTFKSDDGYTKAVIPIEQVVYLVDEILRDNQSL